MPGNGFCLLNAVRECLQTDHGVGFTEEQLMHVTRAEIRKKQDFYKGFHQGSASDLLEAVEQFFQNRDYMQPVVDILVGILAPALFVDIFIYQDNNGRTQVLKFPGGSNCIKRIYLHFHHDKKYPQCNHYSAVTLVSQRFMRSQRPIPEKQVPPSSTQVVSEKGKFQSFMDKLIRGQKLDYSSQFPALPSHQETSQGSMPYTPKFPVRQGTVQKRKFSDVASPLPMPILCPPTDTTGYQSVMPAHTSQKRVTFMTTDVPQYPLSWSTQEEPMDLSMSTQSTQSSQPLFDTEVIEEIGVDINDSDDDFFGVIPSPPHSPQEEEEEDVVVIMSDDEQQQHMAPFDQSAGTFLAVSASASTTEGDVIQINTSSSEDVAVISPQVSAPPAPHPHQESAQHSTVQTGSHWGLEKGDEFPVWDYDLKDADDVDMIPADIDGKKLYRVRTDRDHWRMDTSDR